MLASMNGIVLFALVLIVLLGVVFIWLKAHKKRQNQLRYTKEHWQRQNKDFTVSENWQDDLGPVRVRIIEKNEPVAAQTESETPDLNTTQNNHLPNVLCLYITTKPEQFFYGYDLMQTLLNHNMMHGHLDFFHFLQNDQTLFSIAAIEPPGHFILSNIGDFKTSGLCLFLQPKRFAEPELIFEQMVEIGKKIAEELGGTLEDNNNHLLTPERFNYWCSTLRPE